MSAYTTLFITRSKAKQAMLEKTIGEITDEELEEFMDRLLEPQLYNCRIVNNDDANDDDII